MDRLRPYSVQLDGYDEPSIVNAETRSGARMAVWRRFSDACPDMTFKEFARQKMSIRVLAAPPKNPELVMADEWNAAHPIGTDVLYWTGERKGDGKRSRTRSRAVLMSSGHASLWVEDEAGCIALTHVAAIPACQRPTQEPK